MKMRMPPTPAAIRLAALVVVATTCSISACSEQQDPLLLDAEAVADHRAAIVNGQLESGWQGVGALTYWIPGYGYQGSFCTGTLIEAEWVLTAGHCLTEHEGTPLEPNFVMFYVGTDARPSGFGGTPSSGQLFQADAFVPYDDYDPAGTDYDIGLVHLAEPATGIATYAYNTSFMGGSYVGLDAFYVGYGVTDGVQQDGGGVKRSTSIGIVNVYADTYLSEYTGSGICFGDSGGPGLLQIDDAPRIIGVNSTVAGSGGGGDPCTAYYNHTRVDIYAPWIASVTGAPPPRCQNNEGMCYCALACQLDGSCNNAVCQTLGCEEIYDCIVDCGEEIGCQNDCYLGGTDAGKALLDDMFQCFGEQCEELEGAAFQSCVSDNCQTQVDACMPVATGPQSCEFVYSCLGDCSAGADGCPMACYEQGTATAQEQLDAMLDCFNNTCGAAPDWNACIAAQCADLVNTCMPPADCAITGGDCAAEEACYPTAFGATDCYASQELGAGQICNPNASTLPCDDGLICIPGAFGGRCAAFCLGDGGCPAAEYCEIPAFTDVPDVGYCKVRPTDAGVAPDAATGQDAGATGDAGVAPTDAGVTTQDAVTGTDSEVVSSDAASGDPDTGTTSPDSGGGGGHYLSSCSQASDCQSQLCREVAGRGLVCVASCDPRLGHYDCPTSEESGCVPTDTTELSQGGVCEPAITGGANLNVGEACDPGDGYRSCVSGVCDQVCLMPCGDGQCPPGFACDTSEIADPGVCRPEEEAGCGCSSTRTPPGSALVGAALLGLALGRLGHRRRRAAHRD